jgi:hypothetical protein
LCLRAFLYNSPALLETPAQRKGGQGSSLTSIVRSKEEAASLQHGECTATVCKIEQLEMAYMAKRTVRSVPVYQTKHHIPVEVIKYEQFIDLRVFIQIRVWQLYSLFQPFKVKPK